jgi:hypothetical protein
MSKFTELAPRVMAQLMQRYGLSVEDAAAILGNAGHESGGLIQLQEINPTVRGSRGGIAWFQWTGPRRKAFERWADTNGFSYASDEASIGFLNYELLTSEKRALDALRAAQGLEAKVKAFENAFERSSVKAYASRTKWARQALAAYHASGIHGTTAPSFVSPEVVTTVPPPASSSWAAWALTKVGFGLKPTVVPVAIHGATGPDDLVRRVQAQLQALGYAEVGLADGYPGPKLRAAVIAFQGDNGLPPTGEVDDRLLAALTKASPRAVSAQRANATSKDLREGGNKPAQDAHEVGWLGKAIGVGGIIGGIDQTGIFDSIKGAADTATNTISTVQSILGTIINAVQWCAHHWWVFALVGGLWLIIRAATMVLNLVVLFRQGVLTRPSATIQ